MDCCFKKNSYQYWLKSFQWWLGYTKKNIFEISGGKLEENYSGSEQITNVTEIIIFPFFLVETLSHTETKNLYCIAFA